MLLITLDTTRADRLGAYGSADVATPALDALAAEGVVFEQAWAVAPVTAPTHASLLTGLYPPRHGVRDNAIHYLADELRTLPETLAVAGFRTAAFVSAMVLERRFGLAQGFELYDDDLAAGGLRPESRMMIERPAPATVERALAWLDGLDDGERFFLWVHLFDPHAPYSPPAPFAERYRERPYDGEVAFMDAAIARLLAHPRVAAPEVVVAAVGDHGESLGEHGERTHGLLVYESTLRVPLILRLPQGPRGGRVAAAVSQVDLVPTLLEALALPPSADRLDGVSLLPLIAGAAAAERALYAESETPFLSYGWAPLRALRREGLKAIVGPVPELYDLGDDPAELRDLAAARPAELDQLTLGLAELAPAAGPAAASPPLDGSTVERLRALGYVGGDPARPAGEGRGNPMELIGLHELIQGAGELLEGGRPAEAAERLAGVLARDPDNIVALQDRTRALLVLGRLDEAAAAAARARRLAPWSARAPLVEAEVALRRGEIARALELADQSLAIDPRYQEARLERARYLALLGRHDEAAEELAALERLAGNSPWTDLRVAELVELPAGRLGAAEERLRAAVARDPFLTDGWALLGRTLEQAGRPAEAAAAYREGLGRRPGEPELAARLAMLLAAAGDPAAEAALAEAIRTSPEPRPGLHLALAERLAARGEVGAARRELERAVAAPAETAAAANDRALALARLGRSEEAADLWRALLRDEPGFARAWHNLASLALARRDWAEAERLARAAVERDPGLAGAWNNLGIAAEEQGRAAEAESAYRQALVADPGELRALFNLGQLQRKAGHFAEAAATQERLLAAAPAHAGAHFELGALCAGPLGRPDEGRAHLRRAIELEPGHPRAAQARALLERLP